MSINLTYFAIIGLHGKYDVRIPVYDNKLILIGVNGLGKTTVINFIYLVLSEQWPKLLEFEFMAICIDLDEKSIVITREDMQSRARSIRRHQRIISSFVARSNYPPPLVKQVISHPAFRHVLRAPDFHSALKLVATETLAPVSFVRRLATEFLENSQSDLFSDDELPECFSLLRDVLQSEDTQQVMYLPTYRRIEQDLKALFPSASEDDLRKLSPISNLDSESRAYVELVQFGMLDVERKLQTEIESIQRRTREQLTSLTGSYLQDIIRSRADAIEPALISNMSDAVVSKVLGRVEENTLNANDKTEVRDAIRRIRDNRGHPAARDKYLAYFFSRLLEISSDLDDREASIRSLVDTCNRYFVGKKLKYDDINFTSTVMDADGTPLSWKVLSSGEKQVASLFTHLYLAERSSQIVLIDEPELSLSVRWQRHLLPDILASGNCSLLIAVTHSPFIYKNDLDRYAVDLAKLIVTRPVAG